jgi:hypothetical protein
MAMWSWINRRCRENVVDCIRWALAAERLQDVARCRKLDFQPRFPDCRAQMRCQERAIGVGQQAGMNRSRMVGACEVFHFKDIGGVSGEAAFLQGKSDGLFIYHGPAADVH